MCFAGTGHVAQGNRDGSFTLQLHEVQHHRLLFHTFSQDIDRGEALPLLVNHVNAPLLACKNAFCVRHCREAYTISGETYDVLTGQLLKLLQLEASFNSEHSFHYSPKSVMALFAHILHCVQARQDGGVVEQVPDDVNSTIGDFVFCPHPIIARVCRVEQ